MNKLVLLIIISISSGKILAASKNKAPNENAVLPIKYFIQCQIQDLSSPPHKITGIPKTKIVKVRIDKTNERKSIYEQAGVEIKVFSPVMYTRFSENGDYIPLTNSISFEVYDKSKTVLTLNSPAGIGSSFTYWPGKISISCF